MEWECVADAPTDSGKSGAALRRRRRGAVDRIDDGDSKTKDR